MSHFYIYHIQKLITTIHRIDERFDEILVCAIRIRDSGFSKLEANFSYDEDMEIIGKANIFLKRHPEMLPKLAEDRVAIASWPSEALKYLGKSYKPKERRRPHLAAVHRGPA